MTSKNPDPRLNFIVPSFRIINQLLDIGIAVFQDGKLLYINDSFEGTLADLGMYTKRIEIESLYSSLLFDDGRDLSTTVEFNYQELNFKYILKYRIKYHKNERGGGTWYEINVLNVYMNGSKLTSFFLSNITQKVKRIKNKTISTDATGIKKVGCIVLDSDYNIKECNDEILEIFGFDSKFDLLSRNIFELIKGKDFDLLNIRKEKNKLILLEILKNKEVIVNIDGNACTVRFFYKELKNIFNKINSILIILWIDENAIPRPKGYGDFPTKPIESVRATGKSQREIKEETGALQIPDTRLEEFNRAMFTLENAKRRIQSQEKLAYIGKFAASIAHELRNPLGVISNSLYFLKMRLKTKDAKVIRHLKIINDELIRANEIISSLMNFTKLKSISVQKTNISYLLNQLLDHIETPDNIKIVKRYDDNIKTVYLDPNYIKIALENLIKNAIQSMPDGGTLIVKTQRKNDQLMISIIDTGTGINKDQLDRIFEPLFSMKATGIGLGLAIAKEIVEIHDGIITVVSTVGKGSNFTIYLPLNLNNVGKTS
ncbi:MAG: ATP-binding protein [Promethearchaeota archaeon]